MHPCSHKCLCKGRATLHRTNDSQRLVKLEAVLSSARAAETLRPLSATKIWMTSFSMCQINRSSKKKCLQFSPVRRTQGVSAPFLIKVSSSSRPPTIQNPLLVKKLKRIATPKAKMKSVKTTSDLLVSVLRNLIMLF